MLFKFYYIYLNSGMFQRDGKEFEEFLLTSFYYIITLPYPRLSIIL